MKPRGRPRARKHHSDALRYHSRLPALFSQKKKSLFVRRGFFENPTKKLLESTFDLPNDAEQFLKILRKSITICGNLTRTTTKKNTRIEHEIVFRTLARVERAPPSTFRPVAINNCRTNAGRSPRAVVKQIASPDRGHP